MLVRAARGPTMFGRVVGTTGAHGTLCLCSRVHPGECHLPTPGNKSRRPPREGILPSWKRSVDVVQLSCSSLGALGVQIAADPPGCFTEKLGWTRGNGIGIVTRRRGGSAGRPSVLSRVWRPSCVGFSVRVSWFARVSCPRLRFGAEPSSRRPLSAVPWLRDLLRLTAGRSGDVSTLDCLDSKSLFLRLTR
jgi:hypothetical protein